LSGKQVRQGEPPASVPSVPLILTFLPYCKITSNKVEMYIIRNFTV
jgi:hypothetical protein